MSNDVVEVPEHSFETKRRAAVSGAFFGFFVDMYDIYLPTVVLTPAMIYFRPPDVSPGTAAIFSSLVFVLTLIGRPIGSIIFGSFGDRLGRRKTAIISVSGFGLFTLLIALLPGYHTLGIASYWILVILRFLDGFFLGGEYTAASPLAMEYTEKHRRGFVGGLIMASFPLAYVVINLLTMLMFAIFPLGDPTSPYAVWGWRIPFVIGAIFSVCFVLYYLFKVSESETWEKTEKAKVPFLELFRGKRGLNFLQIFILMSGLWFTQNIVTLVLPTTLLSDFLDIHGFHLTLILLIAFAFLIFSYMITGSISQKIGRKKFFIISGSTTAIIGSALLVVLVNADNFPTWLIGVLVVVFAIITTAPWGVITTYMNERFQTDVRASGFGMGYSLAVVIPSFYAFYMDWFGHIMPYHLTAVVLLFIGALITVIGASVGPETKDVDF